MPLIVLPTSHGSERVSVTTSVGRAERRGRFTVAGSLSGPVQTLHRGRHSINAFQTHSKIIIAKAYMLNSRLLPDTW